MPYRDIENLRIQSRRYYELHKDELKAKTKAYKKAHPEKYRQYGRKYGIKHRDACRNRLRLWISRNREKWNARSYKWRAMNNDKYARQRQTLHQLLKEAVVNIYTNGEATCRWCGQGDLDVLTVDHIANDGAKHRKTITTGALYRWLRNNGYPSGFQILCFNCNVKKRMEFLRAMKVCA